MSPSLAQALRKELVKVLVGAAVALVFVAVAYTVVQHQLRDLGETLIQGRAPAQRQVVQAREPEAEERSRPVAFEEIERAFAAQYRAPEECMHWRSKAHMVECVNHRLRARAAFRKAHFPAHGDVTLRMSGQ